MEKGEHQDPDPVLQLQSPLQSAQDGAHPGRDHDHEHAESQLETAPPDATNHVPSGQNLSLAPQQNASSAPGSVQTDMSQHSTPVLPPMSFQQHQHAPAQSNPPAHTPTPSHVQDGHQDAQAQQHGNFHPQQQQHQARAHNSNGAPMQFQSHPPHPPPPPNYAYPPDANMQQARPPGVQSNGGPPNGYAPHMGYQMPLGGPHLNSNQLPGTRHKKEIKRRTKTGCLTCRKRRIKCDEGHPTCRNCQKSKRECLGYDPIFKSQPQPQIIQPAPGTLPPPHPIKQEAQSAPEPQHYSNVPQGYMPAASAGYSPATVMQPPMEYGAAIDPALGPAAIAPPPLRPPPPQEEYTTSLRPQRNVRLINVDSLFSLEDVPPAAPPRDLNATLPPQEIDMIRHMYTVEYAAGLDRFFETTWYTDHGFNLLLGNSELLHYFAHCVERFRQGQNGTSTHGLMSLEARLIWQLAVLPRAIHSNPLPPQMLTLLQRLETVQNLLCGTFMDANMVPLSPPATPPDPKVVEQYTQYLQDAFWHQLGRFVSIRDDLNSSDAAQQIATALASMRNILSMLENRDVLYSMAIARHFGGRMVDYYMHKTLVSKSAEPDDPIAKLAVAMNFIRDEDSQGTTQVVQRLCGMCRRSWVLQRHN